MGNALGISKASLVQLQGMAYPLLFYNIITQFLVGNGKLSFTLIYYTLKSPGN